MMTALQSRSDFVHGARPHVWIYHPKQEGVAIPGDNGVLYVERNLRCPSCRQPLVAIAALTDQIDADAAVRAILDGIRRLAAQGCAGLRGPRR